MTLLSRFALIGCLVLASEKQRPAAAQSHDPTHAAADGQAAQISYDPAWVAETVAAARSRGDAVRGAAVFAAAQAACLSCHRVGKHGGTVGPDLTSIASQRELPKLVESLYWPEREIKPEFVVWKVVTEDGRIVSGYKRDTGEDELELRDPAGETFKIAREDIVVEVAGTTPMPVGLTASMTRAQQLDLIRFLGELKFASADLPQELETALAQSQSHGPAEFPYQREPVDLERWPHARHPVNQFRLYDYYTQHAEYFREQYVIAQRPLPMLLPAFPGLDGGGDGHWGYQPDQVWTDDRWNETDLGSVQGGVFFGLEVPVPRAVCVRLGEDGELSVCFNPDRLTYEAVWRGGFVAFSAARHGFLDGIRPVGRMVATAPQPPPDQPFKYRGYYRHGRRIVFSYRLGDIEYLDAPWVENGELVREIGPADSHPWRHVLAGGPPQWPQTINTAILPGNGRPYAVDEIELPYENPWNALLFCAGHDFLSDGSAVICTIQGDVWRVDGLDASPNERGIARWRRIASGLHHALGLVVSDDQIYVQCRDQLTRLHDLNGDGEADFYECYSNAFATSPAGHDFICGLERDDAGNFYFCSGNQGLVQISSDGAIARVLATGLRNPDGLAVLPDGTVTVPCSEGEWTPASLICAVTPEMRARIERSPDEALPHFGYRGPRDGNPPDLPLVYLPRGLDNSSGGQVLVESDRWGPLRDQLLHLSFGMGTHFLVLRDEVAGQLQGAVVPLPGDFLSGVHRGRFRRQDGQLYLTGMHGWVSFTPDDGCFQRVRYTGDRVQLPIDFHLHENGVRIAFSEPLDPTIANQAHSHFAQCWNYRYSEAYGSPELSPSHPGVVGHDPLRIASAHVLPDGRSLFIEIPELQPVSQLQLRLHVNSDESASPSGHTMFVTAHRLDAPFEHFPGYLPRDKQIAAHPLLTDMATNAVRVPNPFRRRIGGARSIEIETGKNLTYKTRELHARAGEAIALTLSNPDVVPHNWALVRPETLSAVGELANRMISDPEAVARHYMPQSDDVLFYTDVVPPGDQFTIYFRAPAEPGRYPYLCTFPGHWMVMNGVMIVTAAKSQ